MWKMLIENNGGFSQEVYNKFKEQVKDKENLKILDIGTGIGGLITRIIELDTFNYNQEFIGIDINDKSLQDSGNYFKWWGQKNGYHILEQKIEDDAFANLIIKKEGMEHRVKFYAASVYDVDKILGLCNGQPDVVMGNTVLEHLNPELALKTIKTYLKEGGLVYLPVNADDELIVRPEYADAELDEKITMGFLHAQFKTPSVVIDGKEYKQGDVCCGRNLFSNFSKAGLEVLAYGGSQKTIVPSKGRYKDHEKKYLEFFLGQMRDIANTSNLEKVAAWFKERSEQLEQGKLYMILKQMDILGQKV
jgi:SAM-dependent methyltransferase